MYEEKQIRAVYTETTVRVYQAYSNVIADSAVKHQTFMPPSFKFERMTWIKPSFLWMMYRSGWAQKDEGQRRILAIDISREGFEWALEHACLSKKPQNLSDEEWSNVKQKTDVRIQWDPERDLHLQPLPYRSIQIGLKGQAVIAYANEWIEQITDITEDVLQIHALIEKNKIEEAKALLPKEHLYSYSF